MEKSTKKEKALFFAGAVGAGFLSGLIGAGGGIILYFILGSLYGKGAKENLILSSMAVMFFCLISMFFYKGNAALPLESILKIAIPASLGGLCGALLLNRIPTKTLKKLFAIVIIISGILMLTR